MITQDEIFTCYLQLKGDFDYPTIDGNLPDDKLIPTVIVMQLSGDTACDFGWIPIIKAKLLEYFGERLRPYLIELKDNPLHGGGMGYGEDYIKRSKEQVRRACRDMLFDLEYKEIKEKYV